MVATLFYIILVRCQTCGSRVTKNQRLWVHPFQQKFAWNAAKIWPSPSAWVSQL